MPVLKKPKLAIMLPTYRFDAAAKQALIEAARIGCEDILVHIADNSENPEKHSFLQELAARGTNIVLTCHPRNIGAHANWIFLSKNQTTPFMCLAADDDSFNERYFRAGLDIIENDDHCVAASGLHVSFANQEQRDQPSLYSPPQSIESEPLDRIKGYNNQNSLAYAVTRTSVVQDFMRYIDRSPLRASFEDYLLAFHLLSIGTYRLDRSGLAYVYDDTHWHLPDESFKSYAHYYKISGLPETFAYLGQLHWAVANLHFFRSRFRAASLSSGQAAAIAGHLFERYKGNFKAELARSKGTIIDLFKPHPRATAALSSLIRCDANQIHYIFDEFAHVVAAFAEDLSVQLRDFQHATLHPDAPIRNSNLSVTQRVKSWAKRSIG